MAEQAGIFIAIEGTDGSGKTTHFELLTDKLRTAGYDVATFDFPQYDEPSTYFVKRYLSGAYGSADQVGPYTASLFYSLDRYEAAPLIRQALAEGKIVISNRFTGSNMAHQGTKFRHAEERRGFFIWADNLEYQMLNIPRPDINIVLRVPAEISSKLAAQRQPDYLANKPDIHEADMSHLERSVEVYDDLCNLFPKDFSRIDCVRSGELLPIEAIHKLVWEKLSALLPRPPRRRSSKKSSPARAEAKRNDYVQQLPSGTIITNAGYEVLSSVNMDENSTLSMLTDSLPPHVLANVLANLPESEQQISVAILEELGGSKSHPAHTEERATKFLSSQFVLKDASQLLLMHLSGIGKETHISEQQLYATDFGSHDKHGRFRYYVPPELDSNMTTRYCDTIDRIFETYAKLLEVLTNDPAMSADDVTQAGRRVASMVLPLATTSTAGCMSTGRALENLIVGLENEVLSEPRQVGNLLLEQAGELLPGLQSRFKRLFNGDLSLAPQEKVLQLRQITNSMLSADYDISTSNAISLADIWPRNELDIVPKMLYMETGKALSMIREQAENWTYEQKAAAFEAYFSTNTLTTASHNVLNAVTYSWDIVCDISGFRELQRLLPSGSTIWQALTPRYGYDVPSVIEEAGLSDDLEACFDLSLKLYSDLQRAGYEDQAQYAVLLGHRLRGNVTLNGDAAAAVYSANANNKLLREMFEKLAEKHPLLAEKFTA